jgi:hypothetical protein
VGQLLLEARDEFESQVTFLEWTNAKFNIRKSQAFRLMKIAKEFNGDTRFVGVAMRVLDALAGESEEVKSLAAKLAAEGKLDSPSLQLLQGGKAEDVQPEPLPEVQTDPKPINIAPVTDITPKPLEDSEADSELVQQLRNTLAALVAQNGELLQKLAELQRPKAQTLPMLPHFKAASLHTRLGLTTSATTKEVRAAYREITKHYKPETNKAAFDLLTEAKDALLQEVAA